MRYTTEGVPNQHTWTSPCHPIYLFRATSSRIRCPTLSCRDLPRNQEHSHRSISEIKQPNSSGLLCSLTLLGKACRVTVPIQAPHERLRSHPNSDSDGLSSERIRIRGWDLNGLNVDPVEPPMIPMLVQRLKSVLAMLPPLVRSEQGEYQSAAL